MSKLVYKATLVVTVLFLSAAVSNAQSIPDSVMKAFHQKFGEARQVNWENESNDEFEAEFVLNGDEMSAEFDNKGNWRETETAIKTNDLPDGVKQSLRENFSEAEVEHAYKVTTPDQTLYEVLIEVDEEAEIEDDEYNDQEEDDDDGQMNRDENEEEDYEEEEDEFLYEVVYTADGKIIEKKEIGDDED